MKFVRTKNGVKKMTDEEYKAYLESKKTFEDRKLEKTNKLKAYLTNTDWNGSRSLDSGEYYPQEIKDKRILARQYINDIESSTEEKFNEISLEWLSI